jgi:tetratricopeptide (TPR) repeat protein
MATTARDLRPDREHHATVAIWLTLLTLALSRAVASCSGSRWAWGLDLPRFVPAVWGWLPWTLATLALVPAVGRALARPLDALGERVAKFPALATSIFAAASAALVLALPDRTLFLGDFAMRRGTVATGADWALLFPQAMPLDVFTHVRLPLWLAQHAHVPLQTSACWIGAFGAAMLAIAALYFALALGLERAPLVVCAAIVWGGGYLGMFTGYGKSAVEMTWLTAFAGAFAMRAVLNGGGLIGLALSASLALGFHRSGVLLLPVCAVAFAAAPDSWRNPSRVAGAAIVLLALAAFGPRILHLIATFDMQHHFAAASGAGAAGSWRALFSPLRLADVANVALVLSPLAVLPLALAPALRSMPARERVLFAAFAIPALAMLLLTRPQQGLFRDRDVFVQAGVAFSLIAAGCAGETLRAAPARAWLAAALVLGTVTPSVAWLGAMHDPAGALRHVRAALEGPPERPADERAATWDYLGTRAFAMQAWPEAADAWARAAEAAPNPRLIAEWGMAESMRGDMRSAQSLYRRSVTLNPDFTMGWLGLASASSWNDDTASCAESERAITRLDPGNAQLPGIRAYLARTRTPE